MLAPWTHFIFFLVGYETFQNPTHNQDAQSGVPLVISHILCPFVFALVQSSN